MKTDAQHAADARADMLRNTPEGAYRAAMDAKANAWKDSTNTRDVKHAPEAQHLIRPALGETYIDAIKRTIGALEDELKAAMEDERGERRKEQTDARQSNDAILNDAFQRKQQRLMQAWGGSTQPVADSAPPLRFTTDSPIYTSDKGRSDGCRLMTGDEEPQEERA